METSQSKWMSDLSETLANRRLNHIVVPGSHDSGARLINWSINPSLGDTIYQKVYNLAQHCKFVKNIIAAWTLTQELTVYDQLLLGIRNFDLRLACINDIFYLAHTYICDQFETVLSDIVNFLRDYPNEVIFLQFRSDYENRATMTREGNDKVLDRLYTVLGSYFIPRPADKRFPTLGEVLSGKDRVVLYYDGSHSERDYVWNERYLHDGWTTTTIVNKKLA
ncbi:hypothetical protein LCGC14_2808770, partial [marine sediment metagenome]